MHRVVSFSEQGYRAAFRLAAVHYVVAAAVAKVPGRQRLAQSLDLVRVADAQLTFISLQKSALARRLLVSSLHEVAHAHASLSQQRLAGWERGPRQNVHSVEVADTVAAISLQRSWKNIRSIKLADAHAAIALRRRPGQNVRSIELANARTAVPLQRSGENVHAIKVTDAHAALAM